MNVGEKRLLLEAITDWTMADEMRMGIWLEDNYDAVILGLKKLKESGA